MTDIQCTFSSGAAAGGSSVRDGMSARLKKPEGFRGSPLFADDRAVEPETDPQCQIRPERSDPSGLLYHLHITDFTRCGVLKRNGFVHVRIWFPQFPGVVMQSDQELIIMCKPPESTVIENKAAGFAGSFPHGARVSGVVEETPGRLEYEVALYKEAASTTRHPGNASQLSGELPVDQAVPIGTRLQLRARISPDSAWKYVKLVEVTVSPDPDEPRAAGSVPLVRDGCRNRDFATIIPHQPARYRERQNEVFLDFEAFLLSTIKERSTLWIHSQIKACMEPADCQPDFCLDLFEPSGHGRRRRRGRRTATNASSRFTPANIEYTVLMPSDWYRAGEGEGTGHMVRGMAECGALLGVSGALACLLVAAATLLCWLAAKHQAAAHDACRHLEPDRYTGRPTTH